MKTDSELKELIKEYQNCEDGFRKSELLEELYGNYKNLIRKYVSDICYKPFSTLTREDLEMDAYIGFYRALKNYDIQNDCKFSTYLKYYINAELKHAYHVEDPIVYVPKGQKDKVKEFYEMKKNSEMSGEAIIQRKKELSDVINAMRPILYLNDFSRTEDENACLDDLIEDTSAKKAFDDVLNKELYTTLRKYMDSNFSLRNNEIFIKYFGIDDSNLNPEGRKYTYRELGEMFGLTSSRIGTLIQQMTRKMSYNAHSNQITEDLLEY